jgi:hypothetical protein
MSACLLAEIEPNIASTLSFIVALERCLAMALVLLYAYKVVV